MTKKRVLPLAHALVFLVLNLGTGLTTPVLSLLLMARGATLETLPLAVALTALVTCVCEVPSGIAADVLGRRRVFACAMAAQVAAYAVLLASPTLPAVAASSALRGFALAARTGTLDAIELDRIVAAHPRTAERLAALDALNGSLSLLESAGVGIGALAGSTLAAIDASYALLIVCVILLDTAALVGGLTLFPADHRAATLPRERLRATASDIRATVTRPGGVRLALLMSASAGAVMVVIETYWQLAFEKLAGPSGTWMLGLVSCSGMVAAALGSALAMRWGASASKRLGVQGRRRLYLLLQASMIACLALFSIARNVPAFTLMYALLYLAIGARGVVEQSVLHNAVCSQERSSMASVQSISLRGGGVLATAVSGPLVGALSLSASWVPLALLATLPVLCGFWRRT